MKGIQTRVLLAVVGVAGLGICGCSSKFMDPTQLGRFRPTPAVNVILDSLGVADETPAAWEDAEEPRPSDIVVMQKDYILQPGDVARIIIYELLQEGGALVNDYMINETGKISIPEVGVVQAAGLTETQLEEEIKQIASPGLLKDPSVTVMLMSSQQRTYSILGDGVTAAGRYLIPRYDFRLTDALATAGGSRQFNVSNIYVSRREGDEGQVSSPADMAIPGPAVPELEVLRPETPRAKPVPREPVALPVEPEGGAGEIVEPTEPAEGFELEREMLELITPLAKKQWPNSPKVVVASTEMGDPAERAAAQRTGVHVPKGFKLLAPRARREISAAGVVQSLAEFGQISPIAGAGSGGGDVDIEWVYQDGKWIPMQVGTGRPPGARGQQAPTNGGVNGGVNWVFKNGQWVPVPVGRAEPRRIVGQYEPLEAVAPPEDEGGLPEEMEWEQAVKTRLIKIPADKLLAGDPRYNIVIKPGDTIHVPVDIIGECYIMGNVNRSGFINLTGRPMTLKMAIAAAGGLGPLAWPKRVEVVRRIGDNREEIVMVDLDRIARGEQPDFFVKPHDLINVGTHMTARWLAVLRNAFRASYGFGFAYDRNFAYRDYFGIQYNPVTPWKWDSIF